MIKRSIIQIFLASTLHVTLAQDCSLLQNVLRFDNGDGTYYQLQSVKNDNSPVYILFTLSRLRQAYSIEYKIELLAENLLDSIMISNCNKPVVFKTKSLKDYISNYFIYDSSKIEKERFLLIENIIENTIDKIAVYNKHKNDPDSILYFEIKSGRSITNSFLEIPSWFTDRELLISVLIRKGIIVREGHDKSLEIMNPEALTDNN